jgi:hypothetical protein
MPPTPIEQTLLFQARKTEAGGEDLSSINELLRQIREKATRPAPLSCDLSGDPLACAILRAWARQPWQKAHRAALVDRLEETGRAAAETRWAREIANDGWFRELPVPWPKWNRTARRDATRVWQRMLAEQFGDYENTLRDGAEDTPQGG